MRTKGPTTCRTGWVQSPGPARIQTPNSFRWCYRWTWSHGDKRGGLERRLVTRMLTLAWLHEAYTVISWTVLGHKKLGRSFAKPRQLLGPAITSISPTSLSVQIPGNTNRFLQWGGFVPILHGCFFLPDDSVSKYLPLHAFFFTPDCRSRHWVGDTISFWLSLEVSDFYPICNVLRAQISNIIMRSFNKRKIEVFFPLEADTKHIWMRYNGHIFDYVNNYHLKQMR